LIFDIRGVRRIKDILISIAYLLCVQLVFLVCGGPEKTYCTVLYYHSIPDGETNRFKKQMGILAKISVPIPLCYKGELNARKRYSIVTFDDAFRTVATNGIPELSRCGIPFTLFIPSANLGQKPAWLVAMGHKDQDETVLSLQDLLDISSESVTFGSHTESHRDLTRLSLEGASTEISRSKAFLESNLNEEIRYLSFPHGAYNEMMVEFCRETQYEQVFSILPESPLTPLKNYVKGRTKLDPSDWTIEFVLKAMGGYGWKSTSLSLKRWILGRMS
jgi:peptidoglycan/xylan/chitin deacetylase (PgdA/CDA1 family)